MVFVTTEIFRSLLLPSKTGDISFSQTLYTEHIITDFHKIFLITLSKKKKKVMGTAEKQLDLGVTRMTSNQVRHQLLEAFNELTYSLFLVDGFDDEPKLLSKKRRARQQSK